MFYKFQQKYSQIIEDFGQVVDAPVQGAAPAGTEAAAMTKNSVYGMTVGGKITQKPKKKKTKPYFPVEKQNKLPKSIFGVIKRNKIGM
jgi:hypothetical protein